MPGDDQTRSLLMEQAAEGLGEGVSGEGNSNFSFGCCPWLQKWYGLDSPLLSSMSSGLY